MKKFFLIIIFYGALYAQDNLSISVKGIYTTTAKIYLNPNSSDEFLRNRSIDLSGIYSYGGEVRYKIFNNIYAGLNVEYIRKTGGSNLNILVRSQLRRIEIEDGFELIPIELNAYYLLPFSTEDLRFYMGGGLDYYFGNHLRKFSNLEIETTSRKFAIGFNVNTSLEYFLIKNASLKGELKFRDPQFTVTSKYKDRNINYNDAPAFIPQESFDSKINVDGVTFVLSATYYLNF